MRFIIKSKKYKINYSCTGFGATSGCDVDCKSKCYYCPCVGNFA